MRVCGASLLALVVCAGGVGCGNSGEGGGGEGGGAAGVSAAGGGGAPAAPTRLRAEVVEVRPHDPTAFTQGLEVVGGLLYESTGLYGRSAVRELDLLTGEVLRHVALEPGLFGEGLTAVGDHLVQLTWREGVVLMWDRESLALVGEATVDGEGWGLCYEPGGDRLVQSDGSATLTFRGPEDLASRGSVQVIAEAEPVARLNELECDAEAGLVWANVWQTDEIVGIDTQTGEVAARVDATGLGPAARGPEEVLNGIAALGDGRYLLTGKNWPMAYVVRFVPGG